MTMARWFGRPPCSLLRTSASRIAALEWQYWETSDVPSAPAMCENPCGAPLRLLLRLPLRSKLLRPVCPCLPISTTHSESESRPKAHCTRATPVGSSVPLHVQISLPHQLPFSRLLSHNDLDINPLPCSIPCSLGVSHHVHTPPPTRI